MFLIKIFHFLFGYVILSIMGDSKEKFITDAINTNISIQDLAESDGKYILEVSFSDYLKLKKITKDLEVIKKAGFPFFLEKLKKRKGLIFGFSICILLIIIGSQFIWTIEYDGDTDCNMVDLENAVKISGLEIGKAKMFLDKPLDMKNTILNNTKDICWCFVYIKGTKAVVKVRKNVIPKQVVSIKEPCDLIATRDGVIKRVIAKKGRKLVSTNDAVSVGDTLISGTFDFENEAGYQTHSLGTVEAYTKHILTKKFKQNYIYKFYTGRKRHLFTLNVYKWKIPLYLKKRINYDNYDEEENTYDSTIGISLNHRILLEYKEVKEPISEETTIELAKNELEKEISSELSEGATMLSKEYKTEKIDENTIKVTLIMNFIENIATEKQIEEVTLIEPKNSESAAGD